MRLTCMVAVIIRFREGLLDKYSLNNVLSCVSMLVALSLQDLIALKLLLLIFLFLYWMPPKRSGLTLKLVKEESYFKHTNSFWNQFKFTLPLSLLIHSREI